MSNTDNKEAILSIIENNQKTFPKKHLEYYKQVLTRCQYYDAAPKVYWKTKLDHLPKMIDWYLNIFQTLLLTGIYIANIAAVGQTYQNLPLFAKLFSGTGTNVCLLWAQVLFPIFLNSLTVLLAFTKNEHQTPRLVAIIKNIFGIQKNIAEVELEMMYLSRLIDAHACAK